MRSAIQAKQLGEFTLVTSSQYPNTFVLGGLREYIDKGSRGKAVDLSRFFPADLCRHFCAALFLHTVSAYARCPVYIDLRCASLCSESWDEPRKQDLLLVSHSFSFFLHTSFALSHSIIVIHFISRLFPLSCTLMPHFIEPYKRARHY